MNQKLDKYFCFSLYTTSRLVIRAYEPYLKPLHLTYPQFLVLMCLKDEEKLSVDQIGHFLYLDSGTLSPLLKRLEDRGVITRGRDKKDERRVFVSLSNAGMELKQKVEDITHEICQIVNLSEHELEESVGLLKKCRTNLKNK